MSDSLTVLLVDREPITEHTLSRQLRLAGFCVVVAGDGDEALALAQCHAPDVVLVDSEAIPYGGVGLARLLSGLEPTAHTPVVLMADAKTIAGDTCGTNIRQVLRRPFGAQQIVSCVRECLVSAIAA
ncbi:MAG: response regulator [Phycisphaeraceae bacterium]|nr:response regulator [Phycisphaeraceae bacterium]